MLENLHLKDTIPQVFSEALAFLPSRSARLQTHADLIIADPPDILEKPLALLHEYRITRFFSFLSKNVRYMQTNFIK
jgi:hypothetical protein